MSNVFRRAAVWCFVAAGLTAIGSGQTPVDLSGTWTLDTYLSDNPQQVAASIRSDLGQPQFGEFMGSADEGGLFGRGTGRRGQSPRGGSNRSTPPSAEDQRALDAITQPVRYPPPTLRIEQSSTAVTVGDPQGRSRTFQTNGKREQQMFDDMRADSTAQWEGPQLVVDFDLGKNRKMTYTYSIVPTTHQLMVRVTFERGPNQPGSFEVRFVYNRASSS